MARSTAGLTEQDIAELRGQLADGKRPRVLLSGPHFPVGAAGTVVRIGSPDTDGGDFLRVRVKVNGMTDELAFSPGELSLRRAGGRTAKAAGRTAKAARRTAGTGRPAKAAGRTAGPAEAAGRTAGPAEAAGRTAGPGEAGGRPTGRTAKAASGTGKAAGPAGRTEDGSDTAPDRTAADRTAGDRTAGEPDGRSAVAPSAASPRAAGSTTPRLAGSTVAAPRETAKPAGRARKAAAVKVSFTVSSSGASWALTATRGNKSVVRTAQLSPGVVTAVAELLDQPGLSAAVSEINDAALAEARARAEQLRAELEQLEAVLATHRRP
jgi:hypothetical protein